MQYDALRVQRPFAPQSPEQQSLLPEHVLFAVVQVGDGEIDWHVPPVQLPVQQPLPPGVHASPIDKHCVAPHCPLMQEPVQQSVLPLHEADGGAHDATDDAHVCAFASHTPEQHSLLDVHARPNAEHDGPPSEPAAVDPSSPPCEPEPSLALAPSVGDEDPSVSKDPSSPVPFDPSRPAVEASPPTVSVEASEPHPATVAAAAARAKKHICLNMR
jgi:hypothetical protein